MLALTALTRFRAGPERDLRAELKQRLSVPPRRLSAFMQLTLIGALDVLAGAPAKHWRVALGTEAGAADNFAELIRNDADGEQPMPLTFINSQVHIAGLYLAQITGNLLSIEVGDTDRGGEEALLWQIAAAPDADTLWGWVDIDEAERPGRSDWLRLEREPLAPPLGWLDCVWQAEGGAVPEPEESLTEWLARCVTGAHDMPQRRTVPAGGRGSWQVLFTATKTANVPPQPPGA